MNQEKWLKYATYASVFVSVSLVIVKLIIWMYSGSVSLMASLVDSLMDVAASVINLFAVRYALKPADDDHRFGHGKMESLAGLAQASFIAGSGVFLLTEAIRRIVNPEAIEHAGLALIVMSISLVATLLLVAFQTYVLNKTQSVAIKADRVHYLTDIATNLGIILALGLAYWGWAAADPIIALLIAGFILYGAWEIGRESIDLLMDKELDAETIEKIVNIVRDVEGVKGLHDLKTRKSGRDIFMQMHVDLDPTLVLADAHEIAEIVEAKLLREFPHSEILIHQDPFENPHAEIEYRVF